ncbi:MAG TPA: tyrosine-protein phosphatase [Acetobacteraceae bacterium]|jgi:protein tyrosine/serine phosphatase|nr:tyrosine-protein phosphatase [Acetobacteraceae bacterium]
MAFHGNVSTPAGRVAAWRDSLLVDHAIFRTVWTNFAEVLPGRLYRSNHPTPGHLKAAASRLHLRTLINLRGPRACGSDALSRDTAARLGLNHIDMAFESRGAPHRDRILRYAGIFKELQTPALMHCKSGADRAGLASGLAILLDGGSSADALKQLSWRFGHWKSARTGILDAFFLRYAADAEGRIPFLQWVETEYDEARLKRDFVAGGIASFITDRILRRE